MKKTKKRSKKFCALKHAQRTNEHILKGFAIAYIANGENRPIELVNLKGDKQPVSRTMAKAIDSYRYRWSILLSVYGYERNGKRRMTHDLVTIDLPMFQHELVDFLNETHQALIAEFNIHNEAIGACWLASAVNRDFDEEEAENIYEKLGAWDA